MVFILLAKIISKKVCQKIKNNSTLEKVLIVYNRNAKLMRLLGATFDCKVVSLRRMKKKNLIILNSLQKQNFGVGRETEPENFSSSAGLPQCFLGGSDGNLSGCSLDLHQWCFSYSLLHLF